SPPWRVYGRWRDKLSLSLPSSVHPLVVHRYVAPVVPETALRVGMRVQILALSPAVYRTLHTPLWSKPVYDVYDPHVEGTVIGAKVDDDKVVTLAVQNERAISKVAFAVVTLPYMPGVTVFLEEVERTCTWLFDLPTYPLGTISLEGDAKILDNLGPLPTPYPTLLYPDPETYEYSTLVTDLGLAGEIGRGRARMLAC
ncbi:hypothetical protein C8Q76DRAFT_611405, partial [Earliella scabrosa]